MWEGSMKLVIPVAGKGTRLLPLTNEVPKPLVCVAGRPVLDHVMDKIDGLDVEEVIFITGHLKEQIEQYVSSKYDFPARFVEQKVQDGTAGAINLARQFVHGPVLIIFVDTVFDADLSIINRVDADGILWAKEVEDFQRYGVIVTDEGGYMRRIVEKPSEPISKLANIGLYYIRDSKAMFDGITATLAGPQTKGEWFLTDAFQYMIDNGRKLLTAEVSGWYDCGKVETVIATNRHLLEAGGARPPAAADGVTVVGPVYVADGATLADCTLGPNVSIEEGVVVDGCTLVDTLVSAGAELRGSTLRHCLVGPYARVVGQDLTNMVATREEIAPAP
jgi:glucose-1-phosphate thymidylyltransferase